MDAIGEIDAQMPRRPSPKNLKNPLRLLRALCSERGQAPMTQIRLAQITGIAPDHVRNLENSRRPLNRAQLDKIQYSIGAKWDSKRKTWMVNGIPDEPFNYTWFERYRTLWAYHEIQVDKETHMLCRRLQALLLGVEPSDYNLVFDRIYHALEEIRSELKVGTAKSVFDKTTFKIIYLCDPQTGEIKSIHRSFDLADDEIHRSDIDSKVWGYLDLTPYSSCETHHVGFSIREMILSPRFKFLETKIAEPEQYNEIAEKIRANGPTDA
jgi:transcriptional regulator with XRE-family HTH domain